jgi:hypothetical protein
MFKEVREWATASRDEWNEHILRMTPERTLVWADISSEDRINDHRSNILETAS